jgi:hypothetical protein
MLRFMRPASPSGTGKFRGVSVIRSLFRVIGSRQAGWGYPLV